MKLGFVALVACSSPQPLEIQKLDEAAWREIVVEPYRDLHAEYARAFDAAAPDLRAQLAGPGALAMRPHFAGDPALTPDQARARWALPVMFDSRVATKHGAPVDAVFVRSAGTWHAIVGLDGIVRAHVATFDPACADLVGRSEPASCRDIGWELAEAALRNQRERFARVCTLAQSLCDKRSP